MNIHAWQQAVKTSAIKLVLEHKAKCNDENCNISVFHIEQLLNIAGIPLTDEERKIFI